MATDYKYLKVEWDGTPPVDLIKTNNNPHIPAQVINRVVDEFSSVNGEELENGQVILIPILAPFHKNHKSLVGRNGEEEVVKEIPKPKPIPAPAPIVKKEPEPIVERKIEEPSKPKPKKAKKKSLSKQERLAIRRAEPKKTAVVETKQKEPNKIKYKTYPFTITSPMNTIEAIVRNYNDMNMARAILNKLVYEFSIVNSDKMPPKLGQTVQVPVLLPFVYRHEAKNKVK